MDEGMQGWDSWLSVVRLYRREKTSVCKFTTLPYFILCKYLAIELWDVEGQKLNYRLAKSVEEFQV